MGFLSNKKVIGLASLSLLGLFLVVLYFIGSWSLKKSNQQEIINNLTNFSLSALGDNSSSNLTSRLTDALTQEVITQNTSNPDPSLTREALINKLTSETLANFDPAKIIPVISTQDLNISSNTSSKAIDNYLNSLQTIISQGSLSGVNLSDKTSALPQIVSNYENMISALYKVSVPTNLVEFHSRELSLLLAKLAVYKKINDFEQDPLGAIAAIKSNDFLDSEFEILKQDLNNFLTSISYE